MWTTYTYTAVPFERRIPFHRRTGSLSVAQVRLSASGASIDSGGPDTSIVDFKIHSFIKLLCAALNHLKIVGHRKLSFIYNTYFAAHFAAP